MLLAFPAQYTLFVLLAPLAAIIAVTVIAYARLSWPTPYTVPLLWLLVAIIGWLIFNTLELLAPTQGATLFWSKITYVFIALTPVPWLLFALRYCGYEWWMGARPVTLLLLIPAATVLLAFTNETHGLLWEGYIFRPAPNQMLAINVERGVWFWVHTLYSYGLIFAGAFLISNYSFRSLNLYRRQAFWLILGALLPIAVNFVYLLNLFPALQKDYTPIMFALSGVAFAIGIYRYQLLNLQPQAREAMVDALEDPMLAVDRQGRIVDLNGAAAALVGRPAPELLGRPVHAVLAPWQVLVDQLGDGTRPRGEISLSHPDGTRYYDLLILPLADGRGRLITLRDLTERAQVEQRLRLRTAELKARNLELDAFAHTVAHDLKDPLSTLTTYSQLLERRMLQLSPEEQDRYLRLVAIQARRLTDIVDRLLLLARVRNREEVPRANLGMESIIESVLARLRMEIDQREMTVIYPEQWPVAVGYRPWVEEVWAGYLGYVLKYGGKGFRCEIGADAQALAGGQRVRFWIRVAGLVLSQQRQEELLSRREEERAGELIGDGLTLSIVRRIVERLRGRVGIESAEGEGTLLWFTLPVGQES